MPEGAGGATAPEGSDNGTIMEELIEACVFGYRPVRFMKQKLICKKHK